MFGGEINEETGEDNRTIAVQDSNGKTSVVINADEDKPLVNKEETEKAKEIESNGGTYTPTTSKKPLPSVPTVPSKPKPEETIPPVEPTDPVKPIDPEPPVKPIDPTNPEEKEVDKSELISLYNSTTNFVSTDYDEKSWFVFNNSRNDAKSVIDNSKATSSDVSTAINNLQNGINQLSPVEQPTVVDKTTLTNLYNSTIDYVSTDYESDSWNNFKEVRQAAHDVILNDEATQEQTDSMTTKLQEAINQLVPVSIEETDKTALLALVEQTKDYDPADYTEESWNNFYQAFSEAVDVLADEQASQETVDIAFNKLNIAVSSLEKVKEDTVNKQELINLYNSSASLDSNDYTEKSWSDYILARSDAKTVLDNENATQDAIDTAYNHLDESIKGLVKVEIVNKDDLTKLYNDSASLNSNDYTEKSWNNYILVRSEAKTILADEKATQQEVDEVTNSLQNAITQLEKVVVADKSKLIELYNSTALLNADDYTEASWNNFILAKSEAKSVIDDSNASQSEIDNSYNKLDTAKNSLEKKNSSGEDLPLGVPVYSAEMSAQFESAINDYRTSHGVYTLEINQVARDRANEYAKQDVSSDWTAWTPNHGATEVGTSWSSTKYYTSSEAVSQAISNFNNSPGHKAYLLLSDKDFAEYMGGSVYTMRSIDSTTGATMYSYMFIATIDSSTIWH